MENRKKIVLSIYLILIGLLTAGSAMSLAWFSTSDFLQIDTVNISFKNDPNIAIATKVDGEYKEEVDQEDINNISCFIPVSAMKSEVWMNQKSSNPMFYSEYQRNGSVIKDASTEHPYVEPKETYATEGYYSQEFYLKSTSDYYATVMLSEADSFLKANKETNKLVAKRLYEEGERDKSIDEIEEELNSLEKAMRFSILVDYEGYYNYFIYDPYKNVEETTLYGGLLDSDYKGTYDTKMNSVDKINYEVLYGDVTNRDKICYVYNEDLDKDPNPTSFKSGHNEKTMTIDLENSIKNGVVIAEESSISFEESEALRTTVGSKSYDEVKDTLALIPLDADQPTRIVVSIYLEGWDLDCINYTMGASFNFQLSFGLIDREAF